MLYIFEKLYYNSLLIDKRGDKLLSRTIEHFCAIVGWAEVSTACLLLILLILVHDPLLVYLFLVLHGLGELLSCLLSVRKHGHTVGVTKITHVALISEREVVVEAPLASPVSNSLSWPLGLFVGGH